MRNRASNLVLNGPRGSWINYAQTQTLSQRVSYHAENNEVSAAKGHTCLCCTCVSIKFTVHASTLHMKVPLAASTGPIELLSVAPLRDTILTRYMNVALRLGISWLLVLPSLTDNAVPVVSVAPA